MWGEDQEKALNLTNLMNKKISSFASFFQYGLVVLNHGLSLDCRVPVARFVFVCPEVLILYLSRSCKAITEL